MGFRTSATFGLVLVRSKKARAIAALLLVGGSASAAPNDWAEGSAGLSDGATRDFYNRGALLPWRKLHGDWIDRNGAAEGTAAWATTNVADTDTGRDVSWDVTALVQAWLAQSTPNQGFFLHAGGSSIVFTSREGAAAERPELVLETGGGPLVLEAVADTYLEPSTYQAQGDAVTLRVGGDNNALLRFDLSAVSGSVTSATLRLYTSAQYGGADVGVFTPAPGRQGPAPAVEWGIGQGYPLDQGLSGHADVVLFEDFEAADWMDHWTSHGGSYEVVDSDTAHGLDPLQGKALRVLIPGGQNTGLNTTFDFLPETGAEPEQVYLRYYVRLGNDWNQTVDGGKMPGISGTYGVAGWGGRKSDGTNGWSARGSFSRSVPTGNNPLAGYTPMGSYVYHADMPGDYGDIYTWVDGWGAEGYGAVLANQIWYCLEVHVAMNTPTQNDGTLRAWVDGRLSYEKTDLRFRDVDQLKIETVWMNIYHGGTAVSPADQHLFIDNVVIARSYVGPMGGRPLGGDDAGTPGPDSGIGNPPDAGMAGGSGGGSGAGSGGVPGAGGASAAAGVGTAPGAAGATDEGGCGCRLAPSRPTRLAPLLGLLLFFVARRRGHKLRRPTDAPRGRAGHVGARF